MRLTVTLVCSKSGLKSAVTEGYTEGLVQEHKCHIQSKIICISKSPSLLNLLNWLFFGRKSWQTYKTKSEFPNAANISENFEHGLK